MAIYETALLQARQIRELAAVPAPAPRVAIAHDWLVRLGGAEKCLEEALIAFPQARLLTSLTSSRAAIGSFAHAEASWLQKLPGGAAHHSLLLPAMPVAWRLRRKLEDVDVVLSSSYACAKAVRVGRGIPHVSYCHTPIRYAWSFDEERERVPAGLRLAASLAMPAFRRWDRMTATRVTLFLANSRAVRDRIKRFYGRRSRIVHPPVDTEFFSPASRERSGFVYVARLTGYKRPDLVVRAFAGSNERLTVVGDGPLLPRVRAMAGPNVRFVQYVSAHELRELYRGARAMVFPVNEDFGIAMAEAQACGTPVIGLASGGALDIVEHGKTGLLVDVPDPAAVRAAVNSVAQTEFDASYIAARATRFGRIRFRNELAQVVDALASGATEGDLL